MAERHADRWLAEPGHRLDLGAVDPSSTDGAPGGKAATNRALDDLRDQLSDWQRKLWAEKERSLLVVLQAIDTGGKDGTIRRVFSGVNPAGVTVHSFGRPTEAELAHDFLWRVHAVTPEKGDIGVFNRSHYEDVLVVRVHELVPESVWRPRYGHIRAFEELLASAGTRIVKFLLHISKDEQAERLQARLDNPAKRWKFQLGDLDERARWDDYMAAFEEAVRRTSTEDAPWYVIPANRKWYRNWAVATVLVETLADMNPDYPPPAEDLSKVVIR